LGVQELVNRTNILIGGIQHISCWHPSFRVYRPLLHPGLNPRVVGDYHKILLGERRIPLRNLKTKPGDFMEQPGGIISYGRTATDKDDHCVSLIEQYFALAVEIAKLGRWLLNVFSLQASGGMAGVGRKPYVWEKSQLEPGNYVPFLTAQKTSSSAALHYMLVGHILRVPSSSVICTTLTFHSSRLYLDWHLLYR